MNYRGYTLKSSEHGHHAVKDGTIYSLELFASQEALRRDIDAFLDSDTYSEYLAGKRTK